MANKAFEGKSIFDVIRSGDVEEVEMYMNELATKKGGRADLKSQNVLKCAFDNRKFDIVEQILEIADVNLKLQDESGKTALHYACLYNRLNIAEKIISLDPDLVEIIDEYDQIPAHLALENDNVEMFQFLIESGNICLDEHHDDYNFLQNAFYAGSLNILIYLLYERKVRKFEEDCLCYAGLYSEESNQNSMRILACFKIMYNYLHPENEWRIGFQQRDVFRMIGAKKRRAQGSVPYFWLIFKQIIEMTTSNDSKKLILENMSQMSGLYWDDTPIMVMLLNDMTKENLENFVAEFSYIETDFKEDISLYLSYHIRSVYYEFIESIFQILTGTMKLSVLRSLIICLRYIKEESREKEEFEILEKLFNKCLKDCYIDDMSACSIFEYLFYDLKKGLNFIILFDSVDILGELLKWINPNKIYKITGDHLKLFEKISLHYVTLQALSRKSIRKSIWAKVQAEGNQLSERKQEEKFYAGLESLNLPIKIVEFLQNVLQHM